MKKFLSAFLAFSLTFSFIGTTFVNASEKTYSQQEDDFKKDIEKELKFLFETATKYENGKLYVNKKLLIDKYGIETAPYIAMGIERIYKEKDLASNLKAEMQNRDFMSCMKNELIGMIPGMELVDLMSGNLRSYIEGRMWSEAASYIAKKLVKFGMKSNVAGIVVQLGISAGKCAIWG